MGNLVGYRDLPREIAQQIGSVVGIWKAHLGDALVGVYLHGSIALGAFCPQSGDIDLLIVVRELSDVREKLAIAGDLIRIDGRPRPLEMSAVRLRDVQPWKNPGNCVFHYSDAWTARYIEKLSNPDAECYVADREFPDPDVTGYIRLLRQCGITLYGREIGEVFSPVSDEDFWASISADAADYDFHAYAPRYLASNILILGRILSFREEKRILSKYDGGVWMIDHVPEDLKYLPRLAMREWYDGQPGEYPAGDLKRLRDYLVQEITK